jgi:hypothetical protein
VVVRGKRGCTWGVCMAGLCGARGLYMEDGEAGGGRSIQGRMVRYQGEGFTWGILWCFTHI